jgi:hypothetical protein
MFKIAKKVKSSSPCASSSSCTSKFENKPSEPRDETSLFLKNINVYILSNGMGKNRVEFFKNALSKTGANILNDESEIDLETKESNKKISHIIVVDESTIKTWLNLDKALLKKKFFTPLREKYSSFFENTPISPTCFDEASFRVVTSLWLSECIKQKSFVCTKNYELRPTITTEEKKVSTIVTNALLASEISLTNDILLKRTADQAKDLSSDSDNEAAGGECSKKKRINLGLNSGDSSYSDDDDDEGTLSKHMDEERSNLKKGFIPDSKTWTCAHSSREQAVNHNKFLTDKLESIMSIYETTKEKYRALSYQKAISALKRCPHQIKTKEV